MKRIHRLLRSPGLAALFALLVGSAARAEDVRACLADCQAAGGMAECRFDAQEAAKLCGDESGCQEVRYAYAETCFVEERDEAACDEARSLLQECVAPCRDEHRGQMRACRDEVAACVETACGIELPERYGPPPFRERFER